MQIFAALLRCIRHICAERFIQHIAVVDIEHPSQDWFRDFFRLAGFRRCRCGTDRSLELEPRRLCLRLRKAPGGDETIRRCFAEGRCTRALLGSVAFGEAGEVERRCFRHLLAGFGEGKSGQSTQADTVCVGRDETRSPRSGQEDEKTRVLARKKPVRLESEAFLSKRHRSSKHSGQRSKSEKGAIGVKKARGFSGLRKRHRPSNSGRRGDEVLTR